MPLNEPPTKASSPNRLIPWLQLLRISAAPSAISNILVGFLIVQGGWTPVAPVLLLVLSSVCLYSAGMVSNDLFDLKLDQQHSRKRPLVTGTIGFHEARTLCVSLFIAGLGLAACVSFRSWIITLFLTTTILLYNGPLKKTLAGPIMMGVCRSLNLLLGASYLAQSQLVQNDLLGWPIYVWWISISLGVLITGLTLFAKNESQTNARTPLVVGTIIILTGMAGFAMTQCSMETKAVDLQIFPILILLIACPVILRLVLSIQSCQPQRIQFAVISLLKSLIVFDASFCLLFGQPNLIYPLTVLCLLIPSILLGKWISPT
ncbi:MAG: UbiA family prenyltransferase [Mariniblastus sp.]|nr:UbiA family prenyltransferase [Mariniblastus sp.]